MTSHVEPPDLSVIADGEKLRKILYNLLGNAIKFTPEKGSIKTAVSVIDEELTDGGKIQRLKISVIDTGIGISPEDQERIFNTFEQIDASYTRRRDGTGLGLALTKKLVELHGGRIWVESEGKGKGSIFTFVIPLNPQLTQSNSPNE